MLRNQVFTVENDLWPLAAKGSAAICLKLNFIAWEMKCQGSSCHGNEMHRRGFTGARLTVVRASKGGEHTPEKL